MKVYTKQGDKGLTSLIGGERVFKTDVRVEAYGTVDELVAFVALLADKLADDDRFEEHTSMLRKVESHLMTVEALLAVGRDGEDKVALLGSEPTTTLEQAIDTMQAKLPAITKFTIPGGDERISMCHVCRTICRRAERMALVVSQQHNLSDDVLAYLNRLSDYLYLLGRAVTMITHTEEILWIP